MRRGERRGKCVSNTPMLSLTVSIAVLAWQAAAVRAAEITVVEAARVGDLAAVQRFVEGHADVNTAAEDGSTALLWAAYQSNVAMVRALLAAGADPNAVNAYGVTPLLQASRTGDAAVIEALLDGGADPKLAHPAGETALMAAARTGHLDAVRALLERGADPNAVESVLGETALMWAAVEGHAAVVDALLTAGADPNIQARVSSLTERKNADYPSGGLSALMLAVREGHEDVVRRLVEGGAGLDLKNGDGASAMMIAIVNDRFDLAATLLTLGADPDDGSLYHAVEMRDATTDWYAHDGSRLRPNHDNRHSALDLIALLLDAGADPNKAFVGQMHSASMCCDSFANASPFYRAAVAADVEALKLLIAHGADLAWTPSKADKPGPRANANVGRAALIVAMNGGRGVPLSAGPGYSRQGPPPFREPSDREPAHAVRVLLDAGANPNVLAPDGAPALHVAVATRDLETIRAVAEHGANLAARDGAGKTALQLAESLRPPDDSNPFGPHSDREEASPEEVVSLLRELVQERSASSVKPEAAATAKSERSGA